jgi:hypothetical protein
MVLANDTVYQLQWFIQSNRSDQYHFFTIRACRNGPYTVYIQMVLVNNRVYQLQWFI